MWYVCHVGQISELKIQNVLCLPMANSIFCKDKQICSCINSKPYVCLSWHTGLMCWSIYVLSCIGERQISWAQVPLNFWRGPTCFGYKINSVIGQSWMQWLWWWLLHATLVVYAACIVENFIIGKKITQNRLWFDLSFSNSLIIHQE